MDLDKIKGHPAMDYDQHRQTYEGFWLGTKLLVGFTIALLIVMALTLV